MPRGALVMLLLLLTGCTTESAPPDEGAYLLPEEAVPAPGTIRSTETTEENGSISSTQYLDFGPVLWGSPTMGEEEYVMVAAIWSTDRTLIDASIKNTTERLESTDPDIIRSTCRLATRITMFLEGDVVAGVGSWIHSPAVVAALRQRTPTLERATPDGPEFRRFPFLDHVAEGNGTLRITGA